MFKTPKEKITGVFKAAGAAITNAASDAMTLPTRMKTKAKIKQDTADFNTLDTVAKNEGKPDAGNYTDPLFRARVSAQNIKYDKSQKK